jgi:hypothetical protein
MISGSKDETTSTSKKEEIKKIIANERFGEGKTEESSSSASKTETTNKKEEMKKLETIVGETKAAKEEKIEKNVNFT